MFDETKHGHLFWPITITGEPEEMAPVPEGEMKDKCATFMREVDPEVMFNLLAHMYPTPSSMVN